MTSGPLFWDGNEYITFDRKKTELISVLLHELINKDWFMIDFLSIALFYLLDKKLFSRGEKEYTQRQLRE